MRSCPNCKAEFGDDEVFCPVCGQEIQIVPDFETVESKYRELRRKTEEEHRAKQEELEKQLMLRRRIKQRRRHVITAIIVIAAIIAAVFAGLYFRNVYREMQSYDYQYTKAYECYQNGEYIDAETAIRQALLLDPENADARLLAARIFLQNQKAEEAENILMALIEEDPSNVEAYTLLIDQYKKENRLEDIQTILHACTNTTVLNKYAEYLPEGPAIFPDEG